MYKTFWNDNIAIQTQSNGHVVGKCPFCDKDKHFYGNISTGLWDCKVCGKSGNAFTFLREFKNLPDPQIFDDLKKYGIEGDRMEKPTKPTPKVFSQDDVDRYCANLSEEKLAEFAKERGLSVDILKKYRIGINGSGEFTLPIPDSQGRIRNILRKPQGGSTISSFGGEGILFGIDDLDNQVIFICEGAWSAMALKQRGLPAVGTCGAGVLKDEQVELFRDKEVYIVPDNDKAGFNGAAAIQRKLSGTAIAHTIAPIWPEKKDVRDYFNAGGTIDEFDSLVKQARESAAQSISRYDPAVNNSAIDGTALEWDLGAKGIKSKTLHNVINFFKFDEALSEMFRLNSFSLNIEYTKNPPWPKQGDLFDDNESIFLREYLGNKHRFDISTNMVFDAVKFEALIRAYHPIKNYLNNLVWDGQKRVENWLTRYLGVEDSLYSRKVGEMTLVAACARVDKPGIKYDHMLLIEGAQRMGKSLSVSILGKDWFSEISLLDRDKDTVGKMMGKWILEISEMEVFSKKDIESLKAFITTQTDRVRLPYERSTKDFPRSSIFIGTINPKTKGYFKDYSGNTRFLPVLATRCDTDALRRDVDQLWAEAYHIMKQGYKIHIEDQKMKDLCEEEQEKRFCADDWENNIADWLERLPAHEKKTFTGSDVWEKCFDGDVKKFGWNEQTRIANCLRRLGYESKTISQNGIKRQGYRRVINMEERGNTSISPTQGKVILLSGENEGCLPETPSPAEPEGQQRINWDD